MIYVVPYTPYHAVASILLVIALLASFWKDDAKLGWLAKPITYICMIAGGFVALLAMLASAGLM